MNARPLSLNWVGMLRVYTGWLALAWTALIAISLGWNSYQHEQTLLEQARLMGRTAFEKDILYRRWNSLSGGVYVPVSPRNQPNPYLEVPNREISTSAGAVFTMINPAYMTRQVYELQQAEAGILGHITSLKPIRPENAADEWERGALASFEQGALEASAVQQINGQRYLRLMRPLKVEESCLACHAAQGYTLGQVRGGISESVLLAPLRAAGQPDLLGLYAAHLGLWLAGLLGITLMHRRLQATLARQETLEDRLVEISTHDALTGLFNRRHFEESLREIEVFKKWPVTILVADVDDLKKVNDQQGHAAGDRLIQATASVLGRSFRAGDTLSRTGGDEFVVLLPATDETQVALILERVARSLAEYNLAHPEMPLSFSLGTATSTPGQTMEETLKRADHAMYAAKAARKKS